MDIIISINKMVNDFVWGVPAMICIIGVGLYLSIKSGFVQIRKFKYSMKTTIGRMFQKADATDGARYLEFLCKTSKVVKPFYLVYALVAIIGATMDLGTLWDIADTFNGLMAVPNLISLFLLSGVMVKLLQEYFGEKAE